MNLNDKLPKSSLIEFKNSEIYMNDTRMSPTSWFEKDIVKIQMATEGIQK